MTDKYHSDNDLFNHAADDDAHHSAEVVRGRGYYGTTALLALPGLMPISVSTRAPAANYIYYLPILVHTPITINAVVIEVTIAASSGKRCLVGIYNADTNWQPTSLVIASAAIAIDDNAVVSTSITSTILTPGRYLIAYTANEAATLRVVKGLVDCLGINPVLGATSLPITLVASKDYAALAGSGTMWAAFGAASTPTDYFVFLNISSP